MTPRTLAARGLKYFWRTHLTVALGVGVAVSALGGALIVGESVRASLRDLALSRLGRTDAIVTATTLFTEQLAERVGAAPDFRTTWGGAVPVFALEGVVVHPSSGRRAGSVQVFGVDDRFWRFHGVAGIAGPTGRDSFISTALARELGATAGDPLIIRIQAPSTIPAGVIQGRRDQPGRAVRVNATRVLSSSEMGDFSPRAQQGEARTVFVPLERLQRDVDLPHRINMMLVSGGTTSSENLARVVERRVDLADLGVRVRPLRDASFSIESETGFLSDGLARGVADTAREIGVEPVPVLTYLATAIKANGRETPYSLVSALPERVIAPAQVEPVAPIAPIAPVEPIPPIWLSQWTADDLAAKVGDAVTLEYYLWSDADGLTTSSANFVVAGILPMTGLAVDEDLTPPYPGVSTSADMASWDPPFPVDLNRVRKKDEDFWDEYRTAPKAFIRIEDGQRLWRSTYGTVTSIRLPAGSTAMTDLHAAIDKALPAHVPASLGELRVIPVKSDAMSASAGTTDFGEYFTYFSFFVVVASLMLTVLFFRLGVEQRAAEIGMLGALGYAPNAIAAILLMEGAVVATVGAAIGAAGAIGYSALMMLGLRTWWVDAVGTTALQVHVSPAALGMGIAGGLIAALGCIMWSLRVLRRSSARQLISGDWLTPSASLGAVPSTSLGASASSSSARIRLAAIASVVIALALVAGAAMELVPPAAGFFGSGTLLLIAGLCALTMWLRKTSTTAFATRSWPLLRFGVRNARYRPSRSVLSTALIASASFLIVSVGAFRQGAQDLSRPDSGSGGYQLIGETLVPLMHDPATPAGREALGLGEELTGLQAARFRLRPGDDASCLNLYQPRNPRLIGATGEFIKSGRFAFSASLAESEEERRNPWLLLNKRFDDDAVPVIADATSLSYAFHLGVGDDFVMNGPGGQPLRLRIVGALRDSVLQSELVMHETAFVRLFPRNEGYRLFLLSAPGGQAAATNLEDQLQDFGMDVQSTAERLASYHRVENTYLSTFQALGALGLVLGTLGLGTVLLRNVLERRRELALLRATGYRRSDLVVTVLAESAFLLGTGLIIGITCAAIAIAPAFADRGQPIPIAGTLALLAAVMVSGLLSTLLATRAVSTSALLPALRNE